ncbi:MAG: SBBP repeat-containing protein [Bacteroidota bacterium]|nr:SBBP repeat-containing protein [Bacteroidota bacterium]
MKNLIIILAIFLSMSVSYQFTYSQWVQRYNGPGNDVDATLSIAVDNSGNVYVTGYSIGNGTDGDYATIKYNSSGVRQWVQRYNGSGNSFDEARSIAVDSSGNVYVTGRSFGSGTGFDYATIKYNSSGVQQWVQRYNGPNGDDVALSIVVDGPGNVYVTGYSFISGQDYDYVTIKYDSNGDSIWVQKYNGPRNSTDYAISIAVDGSGNVYVTGYSIGNGTGEDYATIKYNSSGVRQWVQRYNGPGNSFDEAHSIAVDGSGNVYVTGSSVGIGTFFDYATIKYNSSGAQQWVQRYNGPGNSNDFVGTMSIEVDNSGNIYVTGYSRGSGTEDDYATIKYNSNGASLWVQRYNGGFDDAASSIAVDGSENVYVTGFSHGGGGVLEIDYATIKYNSSGVRQWVQRYNGPGNNYDYANSIAVDNSGNVYVTGNSVGIGDNSDYATIKYSQQPTLSLGLTALIQGFYNNITNTMVSDTVRVYLRNTSSPYSIVDSANSILDSTGYGTFYFPNAVNGTLYYIVSKHRNSIETWSKQGEMFTSYQLSYDFITAANKAYGDNLILKGSKYCIYSGDVNQDGIVDLSDLSMVDNDVYNSVSGYVVTDVDGDNMVDISDESITDNNAFHFVDINRP